jgi:hypothetical protein
MLTINKLKKVGSVFGMLSKLISADSVLRRGSISRAEWYRHIAFGPALCDEIVSLARQVQLNCCDLVIDQAEFEKWRASCEHSYPRDDPACLPADIRKIAESLRTEKLLEYFVTLKLARLGPMSVVADIGSAQSKFLEIVVEKFDATGWAVDPSLKDSVSRIPQIHYVPDVISAAISELPMLNAIVLHCSFEMFEPLEMEAMIRAASQKLLIGGRLIIAPLYLENIRTIYLDKYKEALPDRLADGASAFKLTYVKDYWGLEWSEWLSPDDLARRLVLPFESLKFTLYKVSNASSIDANLFLRFIGVWEKTSA